MRKSLVFTGILVLFLAGSALAGSLLDLIPGKAGMVVRADVEKLTALSGTAAVQNVKDVVAEAKEAVAIFLPGKDGWMKPELAVLISGTFSEKAMFEKLTANKNGKATKWEGLSGWAFDSQPASLLVLLDPQTLAVGQEEALKAVLGTQKDPAQGAAKNQAWSDLLKPAANTPAWMGSLLTPDLKTQLKTVPVFAPLAGLESVEVIATIGASDAELKGSLQAESPDAAKACSDFVTNAITALKGIAGQGTPQEKFLTSAGVELQGNSVQVLMKWPRGNFVHFLTLLQEYTAKAVEPPPAK